MICVFLLFLWETLRLVPALLPVKLLTRHSAVGNGLAPCALKKLGHLDFTDGALAPPIVVGACFVPLHAWDIRLLPNICMSLAIHITQYNQHMADENGSDNELPLII